jgi:hypothetical protein
MRDLPLKFSYLYPQSPNDDCGNTLRVLREFGDQPSRLKKLPQPVLKFNFINKRGNKYGRWKRKAAFTISESAG